MNNRIFKIILLAKKNSTRIISRFIFRVSRGTTYYANPSGGDDGTLAQVYAKVSAGDKIILRDGTYPNMPIIYKDGLTIEAEHDGSVLIDGEGVRTTVLILANYVKVIGINACNSLADVFATAGGSREVEFKRCVGWNANISTNNHVFSMYSCEGVLVEDCAGFGTGRKIMNASQNGNWVTFRRCFGVWEGHNTEPTVCYQIGYNNNHCTYDCCIGMVNRHLGTVYNQYGVFGGTKGNEGGGSSYITLKNSIGFYRPDDVIDTSAVLSLAYAGNITIDNVVLVNANSSVNTAPTASLSDDAYEGSHDNVIKNVSIIGAHPNANVGADANPNGTLYWTQTNILVANNLAEAYPIGESIWNNNQAGAQLDANIFLNWPMNQRIKDAMVLAGYTGSNIIDIIAELTTMFGTV